MSDEQFSDGEYRNQGLGTVRNAAGTKRDDGPMEVVMFPAKDREEIMPGTPWGRRELLKVMSAGAAAGFLAGGTRNAAAQQVKWSAGTEPPKLKAPANSCDCHHHIYDARYPVDPKSVLRPGDALVEDYRAFQKRIGTSRNVVVTPSTYGIDNRVTLDAVAAFGPTARAVVVVDDTVTDAELKRMHGLGARGIRFNLAQAGATTPEMIEPLSKRVNDLGWHIQINATATKIMEIMPILDRVPSTIVFDHLAHIPEPEGVNHPLFAQIRALIDKGRTWVKLSGAYADTKVGPPTYADSTAVAQAYVRAAPERLVWGSDWPHPSERENKPDDAVLFDLLLAWAPNEAVRRRILVENPAVLYDYPKSA
jgi:D-galactarolactone isomerase